MKQQLSALCASLIVCGCAHVPQQQSDGLSFETRRVQLEALAGWEMRGRLTIDADGRASQARFLWRQQDGRVRLTLRGPVGVGGVEISGTEAAMTVRARGEQYELTDPEAQLSELLGWWLPVTSLDHWLLGLPDRLFEAIAQRARDGTLNSLEQRFWRLDYATYELSDDWLLPRRIDMNHDGLHLRLTVDTWRPVPANAERLN
jgi:outer membrane lipoprotein LolB